ncbi:MAG: alpha/beta hydrolase [Bacteroidetes bacterium SW_11_45_7]|nr:MAG: alpha/beta hydrolase [Bacteroidetes bacterium SW_11_45_7]
MPETGQLDDFQHESLFIPISDQARLHLKRIAGDLQGPPVFMIHGSIENGRIFYSKKGKGFGPYLARQGFDVFIADLRGKGQSTPPIDQHATFSQTDAIREDIPAFLSKINGIKGEQPIHFVAHSWGGVLFLAHLARRPATVDIGSMVMFGTKRRISVFNRQRFVQIDVLWSVVWRTLVSIYGYLPADRFAFGADNESRKVFHQTTKWIYNKQWIDPEDSFDYGAALRKITLPPALYLTGVNDYCLGHKKDVQLLMGETGQPHHAFWLLGKANGNRADYNHVDILTHPQAPNDHFPDVEKWMRRQRQ